ncbi:hypothetical protein FPOAC2_07599 [Fusarium poae]|uniref:hypothetical protein n=1 Tax=Fusarium poae TaxID=36050 RepID=UPI001CE955CF|nr:hypothetical protein FPOAC1_007672 [Fusarium poae]KAG8668293.1 hypothetical protein FPOAC1_007672 [Fusarium poae]
MKSNAVIAVLVSLTGSGVLAGPCKPVTSQATQVTSATTEESTFIDLTTTITASDTTAESHIPSTTDVSSETTVDATAELTTTTAIAETTSAGTTITLDASTTTAEPSTTTTSPPQCPTPVPCNNLGFDWGYYSNPAQNTDTTYSNFVPESFKQESLLLDGTSRRIGGLYESQNGVSGPIYGSRSDVPLNYFALNHHGYLYTCEAGTYKFDIPYANDAVYLWLGAKAYAGWTSGNADAKALYNQPDHIAGSASFQVNLPASTYIPIRFVYGQAQYGGGFTFKVTDPNGQVLVGDDVDSSLYVVRYSCDGVTAPAYPPFGQEI